MLDNEEVTKYNDYIDELKKEITKEEEYEFIYRNNIRY